MARRRLTSEEIELWHKVVDKTDRLQPALANQPRPMPKPKPAKYPLPKTDTAVLTPVPQTKPKKPTPATAQGKPALHMDRKAFVRMKRGKLVPEGRIDLHGLTLDRAHPTLTRFILTSQASGKRLVLVITGKGKPGSDDGPIPVRHGVLKHQVPQWLAMPPLAQAILQITPAHISHGGGGAFYVYLRKGR